VAYVLSGYRSIGLIFYLIDGDSPHEDCHSTEDLSICSYRICSDREKVITIDYPLYFKHYLFCYLYFFEANFVYLHSFGMVDKPVPI
jgi:hypothetical protein